MTANQIANAANIEAARHNEATETEVSEHNRAIEDIEKDRNRINEEWNAYQEEYSTRQQNWKEQYDFMYLQYQQANEAAKRTIEQQLADIQQQQADAEQRFKEAQEDYYNQIAHNDYMRTLETERHNKAAEGIQYLEWQTQDKWIEYQNWANVENVGIEREKLKQNWTKIANDQYINQLNVEINREKNALARDQFEWNKQYQEHVLMNADLDLFLQEGRNKMQHELNKSEEFRNYASGIASGAQALMNVTSVFSPLIGNKKQIGTTLSQGVKYGKEIAEALLFK